jgi:signal transduction histidine kinase
VSDRTATWWLVLLVMPAGVALDIVLNLLSPPTTGWLGPHGGLIAQLLVDVSVPLLVRFPRAVAGFALLVTAILSISDKYAPGSLVPAPAVTLLIMPAVTPIIVSRIACLPNRATAASLVAGFVVFGGQLWAPNWSVTPSGLLATLVPALSALYFDARRRLLRSLRDRAERAERERNLLAERAVFEERRRLATEMHDVVTHRLSLMVLHAGALGVSSADSAVRRAAEDIRHSGSQALDELRDLLGVLRDGRVPEPRPALPPELRCSPSPEPLPDPAVLVTESASVGVPVDLRVDGDPALVSASVARTAYRVVQEALTNVRKHAPAARVRAELSYRATGVRVRVANTRPAGPPDPVLAGSGGGSGLTGLRHRVGLIGGSLEAGPTDDGGWRITAILPACVSAGENRPHDSVAAR